MQRELLSLFYLDPDVVFLNHGSFGACPRPVFEAYQYWQRELEREPVRFFQRDLGKHLAIARRKLAAFLGGCAGNLLFVPNATHGANMAARSIDLHRGDEVLTTDHEYGACDNAWDYYARETGASVVRCSMPLPQEEPSAWMARFWSAVTEKTRVIYLSHITSPTALLYPVEEICRRARQAGIFTVVDGAHAPGQIDLNLDAIGADMYFGNCHKWLMAPKGSGFLYVRPEHHAMVKPLVVGWGLTVGMDFEASSPFINQHQWTGTVDYAAYLAVGRAVDFQKEMDWPQVRATCRQMLEELLNRLADWTGFPRIQASACRGKLQMGAAEVPKLADPAGFQRRLFSEYGIEIPVIDWQERSFVRVSIQGYNASADGDALLAGLKALL